MKNLARITNLPARYELSKSPWTQELKHVLLFGFAAIFGTIFDFRELFIQIIARYSVKKTDYL